MFTTLFSRVVCTLLVSKSWHGTNNVWMFILFFLSMSSESSSSRPPFNSRESPGLTLLKARRASANSSSSVRRRFLKRSAKTSLGEASRWWLVTLRNEVCVFISWELGKPQVDGVGKDREKWWLHSWWNLRTSRRWRINSWRWKVNMRRFRIVAWGV